MARHRRYSLEFKRRVVQEHLADGMTLSALARHHDISRNLIRLWVEKHEAGEGIAGRRPPESTGS